MSKQRGVCRSCGLVASRETEESPWRSSRTGASCLTAPGASVFEPGKHVPLSTIGEKS